MNAKIRIKNKRNIVIKVHIGNCFIDLNMFYCVDIKMCNRFIISLLFYFDKYYILSECLFWVRLE